MPQLRKRELLLVVHIRRISVGIKNNKNQVEVERS